MNSSTRPWSFLVARQRPGEGPLRPFAGEHPVDDQAERKDVRAERGGPSPARGPGPTVPVPDPRTVLRATLAMPKSPCAELASRRYNGHRIQNEIAAVNGFYSVYVFHFQAIGAVEVDFCLVITIGS